MNLTLKKFFSSRFATVLFHLLVWASLFILQFTMGTPFRGGGRFHEDQPNAFPLTFVFLAILATVYYINYYWLLPRVFINNRYLRYLGAMALCALLFGLLMHELTAIAFTNVKYHRPSIIMSFFPFLFIWAVSTALRLTNDRLAEERDRKENENEHLKSELSFLRSQISPHFMFNIMNTIVSLSRRQPKKVEPVVIQLSQLMRYMLYDSDEAKVSLENEVEYLQSYIDLQELRFGDSVKVSFQHDLEGDANIEPMLLIPFVEIAFKHGVGMITQPEINISLTFKEHQLHFHIDNKYNKEEKTESKDTHSGIGLKNVTRRLSLMYGNHHTLKINQQPDRFIVNLTIKLSK